MEGKGTEGKGRHGEGREENGVEGTPMCTFKFSLK